MNGVDPRKTPIPGWKPPEPRDLIEATLTPIVGRRCGWAMTDRYGEQYPHDTKAHFRIDGAGEMYDGDFCARHAAEAALYALNDDRRERRY